MNGDQVVTVIVAIVVGLVSTLTPLLREFVSWLCQEFSKSGYIKFYVENQWEVLEKATGYDDYWKSADEIYLERTYGKDYMGKIYEDFKLRDKVMKDRIFKKVHNKKFTQIALTLWKRRTL